MEWMLEALVEVWTGRTGKGRAYRVGKFPYWKSSASIAVSELGHCLLAVSCVAPACHQEIDRQAEQILEETFECLWSIIYAFFSRYMVTPCQINSVLLGAL